MADSITPEAVRKLFIENPEQLDAIMDFDYMNAVTEFVKDLQS